MNWGYKITIVIVVFIASMLAMVAVSFKQNNEMIDANYYDKEMKYQSLIDGANNLNSISTDSIIRVEANHLLVTLPINAMSNFKEGNIEFIKNDDMSKDHTIKLVPDKDGKCQISRNKFATGFYTARVFWTSDEKNYYKEQRINLSAQ